MARPPKPTQQKQDQGTLRAHRERDKAPEPPPLLEVPPTPAGLCDVGRKTWAHYAPLLVGRRFLTTGDLLLLEMLCREWARYLDLAADVARDGASIETATGPKRNPAAIEMNAAFKNALACLRDFGLTPSSRVRVRGGAEPPAMSNPWDKLRIFPGGKAG
ncbi:MAG: phage terminase small subunit P27 family [Vicinamibacteria bacterium]|nr:phage terminase small subunit P27 family [Vicinamibacteria bacterium]